MISSTSSEIVPSCKLHPFSLITCLSDTRHTPLVIRTPNPSSFETDDLGRISMARCAKISQRGGFTILLIALCVTSLGNQNMSLWNRVLILLDEFFFVMNL